MAINNLNSGVGIQPTIVDAKGDLIVATGADAVNRLAVGTTANQQLVVDSSTSTGLKWAAPAGLVLLNTTSFSGVTSQSINNVFTSTYDNYRILISLTSVASDGILTMRLRASGSDNTSGQYYTALVGVLENNTTANMTNAAGTSWSVNEVDSLALGGAHSTSLDLFNPARAFTTTGSLVAHAQNSAGFNRGLAGGLFIANSTAYDGFTILHAGNISGKVFVYGYNQ